MLSKGEEVEVISALDADWWEVRRGRGSHDQDDGWGHGSGW